MFATTQTRTQVPALCKYIVVIYFGDSIKRLLGFFFFFREAGAFSSFFFLLFCSKVQVLTCAIAANMFYRFKNFAKKGVRVGAMGGEAVR